MSAPPASSTLRRMDTYEATTIAKTGEPWVCTRSTHTFAALYDLSFMIAQRRGLESLRREVAGRASGVTVEIGAGTGLNLEHYTDAVQRLIVTEPDENMVRRLEARLPGVERKLEVVKAPAERLPLPSGSVDTVVSTLVLCTAPDPDAALAEAARVLRPGGRFLFIEHVRSDNRALGAAQDLFERPWFWFACGCHCNRDLLATIRGSGLVVKAVREERLRGLTPLLRPLIIGEAARS